MPHRQFAMIALGALALWSNAAREGVCQATPQAHFLDVSPKTGPSLIPTDSSLRLSDLVVKEQWSEAAQLGRELALQGTKNPAVSYYLGLALVRLGDPVGAIHNLRDAERLGMDTAYLHQVLGIAYYNVHQFILFEQQMDKSISLDSTDYKSYFYRGQFLESIRTDFPGALKYFEKARTLNPDHTESWYHEGYCFETMGRYSEARSRYDTAVRLVERQHEKFSLPYQGIARLLVNESPSEALEFACKAAELEPASDSNHVILGKIYEKLGRRSQALEELQAAVRIDPANASPRFMLARIYQELGDREAAAAELAMFEKINQVYGRE